MKIIALNLIAIFIAISSHGQILGRFYYNKNWELTKKDSSAFFRVCVFDTSNYYFAGNVQDFTKEGKIIMRGPYVNRKKHGEFIFYYVNGNIKSSGLFEDDYRKGIWKYFYANGTPKSEVEFTRESYKVLYCNDSTGARMLANGTGNWIEEYDDEKFPEPIINEGKYKNYLKVGEWTCRTKRGTEFYIEKYGSGKLINGSIIIDGKKSSKRYYEPINNHMLVPYNLSIAEKLIFAKGIGLDDYPFLRKRKEEHFIAIEESAYPEGGMQAFYRAIATEIRYPPKARQMKIQGRVFVEFVINEDGSLSDIRAIKGIGGGCDEEAVRVVEEAGKKVRWKPGMLRGMPTRQRYTLPLIFKLG